MIEFEQYQTKDGWPGGRKRKFAGHGPLLVGEKLWLLMDEKTGKDFRTAPVKSITTLSDGTTQIQTKGTTYHLREVADG